MAPWELTVTAGPSSPGCTHFCLPHVWPYLEVMLQGGFLCCYFCFDDFGLLPQISSEHLLSEQVPWTHPPLSKEMAINMSCCWREAGTLVNQLGFVCLFLWLVLLCLSKVYIVYKTKTHPWPKQKLIFWTRDAGLHQVCWCTSVTAALTWEDEAEGLRVQGQPELRGEILSDPSHLH